METQTNPVVVSDSENADWLGAEVSRLAAAVVRYDAERLLQLAKEYQHARATFGSEAPVPVEPWESPLVRFGAALALGELAETASHTVVDPKKLVEVLKWDENSEKRRILLALALRPQSVGRLAELVTLTSIHRANLHPQIRQLEELGLVSREPVDRRGRWLYSLTSEGWALVELLREWTGASYVAPQVRELVHAGMSQRDLAERVTDLIELLGARHVGTEMGRLTVYEATEHPRTHLSHFCRALARCANHLDIVPFGEFYGAFADGVAEVRTRSRRFLTFDRKRNAWRAVFDTIDRLPWDDCRVLLKPLERRARSKPEILDGVILEVLRGDRGEVLEDTEGAATANAALATSVERKT